jgi:transcriptional regulator with XRE-family HTH domain
MEVRDINRLKLVLVEKKRTAKWLAEELQKAPATVSKWCTNTSQPSLEMLMQIAKLLEVQVDDLLRFEELPEIKKSQEKLRIE